jgi:hypothetical protein
MTEERFGDCEPRPTEIFQSDDAGLRRLNVTECGYSGGGGGRTGPICTVLVDPVGLGAVPVGLRDIAGTMAGPGAARGARRSGVTSSSAISGSQQKLLLGELGLKVVGLEVGGCAWGGGEGG